MKRAFFLGVCLLVLLTAQAQVTLPPSGGNQKSAVTQYIGPLAHVTVVYNSPDVTAPNGQDRKGQIWGQLVPYGFVRQGFGLNNPSPWRAGANENTVIKFSHDVLIEGKPLPAGKYGFFIAPAEEGPWTLVFSKNSGAWGSYYYEEKHDALRVEVAPIEGEYREWLTYDFTTRAADHAVLEMAWEHKRVPFRIEVPNHHELVVANLREELTNQKGFSWVNVSAAANYCLQNDVNLEEALTWAETAISAPFIGNENFTTLSTKAGILMKLDKKPDAMAIMAKAIEHPTATVLQIHQYGRQLIGIGDKEKAMEVFEYNMERHGDIWPVRVGMMRGLSALGKFDEALKHAKVALERAPDQLNKDSLANAISSLEKKQDVN